MGVMPTARGIENSRNDKSCQLCLKLSNDSGILYKPCGKKMRILVIKWALCQPLYIVFSISGSSADWQGKLSPSMLPNPPTR